MYKLIESCGVRDFPNVGDEYRSENVQDFKRGDFVSVDLICPSRLDDRNESVNGPFLRLADKTGWLFEQIYDETVLVRVPLEVGFWTFYVDNYPNGIALRSHPTENKKRRVKPDVIFYPMQKIFCDRKVTSDSGINYYRVQGIDGWVFDKLGQRNMLVPEHMVRTGLYAYQNISKERLLIRSSPHVSDSCKTPRSINVGEIVTADLVFDSTKQDVGNGPFIRLTDGVGWLFEKKYSETMMEELPVISGLWKFRVVNSVGIAARLQPIDSQRNMSSALYKTDEECICDRMIASPSGVNFYRVKNTIAWVFDKREDKLMLRELSSSGGPQGPWTPDFVRGVAIAVGGIEEILFNDQSRLISFQDKDGARLIVYYTKRTIGIAFDQPKEGKTHFFRRNCSDAELTEVLKNPHLHLGAGDQHNGPRVDNACNKGDQDVDGEADLRLSLLECDRDMQNLLSKKSKILKSIDVHAKKRAIHAKKMDARRDTYLKQFEAEKESEVDTRKESKKSVDRNEKNYQVDDDDDDDEDEVTLGEQLTRLDRNESTVSAALDVRDDNEDAPMSTWCLCSPKEVDVVLSTDDG